MFGLSPIEVVVIGEIVILLVHSRLPPVARALANSFAQWGHMLDDNPYRSPKTPGASLESPRGHSRSFGALARVVLVLCGLLCAFYAAISAYLAIGEQAPGAGIIGSILGIVALALFYGASRV